jgi:hypothetical protein
MVEETRISQGAQARFPLGLPGFTDLSSVTFHTAIVV